jgi:hypothetical protein
MAAARQREQRNANRADPGKPKGWKPTSEADHFEGSGANSNMSLTVSGVKSTAGVGICGNIFFHRIQASAFTKATWNVTYLDDTSSVLVSNSGGGWRAEADRITGLRFFFNSGTGTGKFTLLASA